MNTKLLSIRKFARGVLHALAVTMSLSINAAPDYSLLTYEGADRQQRLLAAAKAEGTLTLYTTIAEKDLAVLIVPVEKKYDIKVKVCAPAPTKCCSAR